jgi:hypothetical protein
MKQLNSTAGVFGPFNSIKTLQDRYQCDGADFQFTVVGDAVIEDYVQPPLPPVVIPVPSKVTRRQARQALVLADKYDLVQSAINAIPDTLQRKLMQIEWDDSQEFERTRPSLIAIGTAIGLTSEGLDALFITASTL